MTVRERILRIRRRVAAIAVAVFIALFATIYVQMASGNDPALSTSSQQASTTTSSSSSNQSSSSDSPSAVTTRQS